MLYLPNLILGEIFGEKNFHVRRFLLQFSVATRL